MKGQMNLETAHRFKGILMFSIILLIAAPTASTAAVIYDLAATCDEGCDGTATGVLTLSDDYIPGLPGDPGDFISLSFSSSSGVLDLDPSFVAFNGATMPVVSGTADFLLVNVLAGFLFQTETSGDWFVGPVVGGQGSSHTWTLRSDAIPEPSVMLLLGLGLAGLGYQRRCMARQ